jgi:hypothetical protein
MAYGEREDDHQARANAAAGLGKALDVIAYKHLKVQEWGREIENARERERMPGSARRSTSSLTSI